MNFSRVLYLIAMTRIQLFSVISEGNSDRQRDKVKIANRKIGLYRFSLKYFQVTTANVTRWNIVRKPVKYSMLKFEDLISVMKMRSYFSPF